VNDDTDRTTAAQAPRRTWPRRRIVLVALAIVFIFVIVLVRQLQTRQKAPPAFGAPPGGAVGAGKGAHDAPVAVTVATVVDGDIQLRIPARGTVTPLATVTVRTQVSGLLQKIAFTEGQIVRAGDFLAQIDPRPYEAALLQAKGGLERDRALLADAKLDLTRYENLVKEDSIAVQQLDTQRALVEQYAGTIDADQGQVNTATVNLMYTHIVSPVTGRVGLRQVDQGNYVTPGDANGIVVINQLQPITVLFSIPEDNIAKLMRRLHAGAVLTVEAYDRTDSTKLAVGRLLTADNTIDTTTGTVKLRAQFDNRDGLLYPNQFVNIELLEDLLPHQLIIPSAAVHRGAPKGVVTSFVYVVARGAKTVSVRPVTLGVTDGDRVAVGSGLAAGEIVVTEGGDRLRDGAAIELPAQP
jgi:multidrug efflux system membrane fusion protein